MEVNAQLLGGAAVTVFLALLFFGVVVLWDVALALRSVGDKIDKLEDNIDDDLTDIGHSLDNISNAPGGGGGTQLHLSGGTISSGPAAGQAQGQPTQGAGPHAAGGGTQQPRQPAQQPRHESGGTAGADAAAAGPDAGIGRTRTDARNEANGHPGDAETAAGARAADSGPAAGDADTMAGAGASEGTGPLSDTEFEPAADDVREPEPAAEDDATTEPAETPGEAGVDEDDATAVGADAGDDSGSDSPHPRADQNRGRFVTSPDRTAWYAVRLDRGAISDTEPAIAGELTDGSETDDDEAEVIAAGPGESTATAETAASASAADATGAGDSSEATDDPVVAAPPADGADGESDDRDVETEPADSDAALDETEGPSDEGDADDPDEDDTDDDPDEGDLAAGEDSTITRDGSESGDEVAPDETESAAETPSDDSSEAAPDDGSTDAVDEPESGQGDRSQAETELEPVDEADDVPDDSTETDPDAAADRSDDGDSGTDPGSDAATAVEAGDPLDGDVTAFEFDEEDLDDVTVEEAVDTINEDAPAPELSSHQFDVSAEVYGADEDEDGDDGDGADVDRDDDGEDTVLTYEFDTDTVEISGSTKRLLQYQLRSFADRDATPEADVSIGPDRIVIEIPDSDGEAVQRWSEAAVDIIDRTLYLSDNSSDDR